MKAVLGAFKSHRGEGGFLFRHFLPWITKHIAPGFALSLTWVIMNVSSILNCGFIGPFWMATFEKDLLSRNKTEIFQKLINTSYQYILIFISSDQKLPLPLELYVISNLVTQLALEAIHSYTLQPQLLPNSPVSRFEESHQETISPATTRNKQLSQPLICLQ